MESGKWKVPSGVHSLTPKPLQISSMAIAKPKAPVSTHNMFNALAENIGSDGQTSTIQMTFGQIAKVVPPRPRRARSSTSKISAVAVSN